MYVCVSPQFQEFVNDNFASGFHVSPELGHCFSSVKEQNSFLAKFGEQVYSHILQNYSITVTALQINLQW